MNIICNGDGLWILQSIDYSGSRVFQATRLPLQNAKQSMPLPHRSASPEQEPAEHATCPAVRCGCGALLARYVPAGIEPKCRRCKRTFVVPFPEAEETRESP